MTAARPRDETSGSAGLLDRALADPVLARRVQAVTVAATGAAAPAGAAAATGEATAFEHVVEAAHALVAALVIRATRRRAANGRAWVVAENVRAQEAIHNELLNWVPEALLLPTVETGGLPGAVPDPEIAADRLAILQRLGQPGEPVIAVVADAALADAVPTPEALDRGAIRLREGEACDRDRLLARLVAAGYERAAQVGLRGQYAVRGGIVDVFSWHHALPVRIEFGGDAIGSLRRFDPDAQTSVEKLAACTLLAADYEAQRRRLRDWIGPADLVIAVGAATAAAELAAERGGARILEGAELADGIEDYGGAVLDHGLGAFDVGDLVVAEAKREALFRQLGEWCAGGWSVHVLCNNEGERERLRDLLPPALAAAAPGLVLDVGALAAGFIVPGAKLAVLSDAELFGRYRHTAARRLALQRARRQVGRAPLDFSEIAEGDLVVHLEHGIGRLVGLRTFDTGAGPEEVLALEFADHAKLYVPLDHAFLVARYVGVGKRNPPLSALGDSKWARARKAAEKAVFDYAAKLLRVQAERTTSVGHAFAPDARWQEEFERSFLFQETADQLRAIADTKADMETARPMDRLICGDVGFGKTEVAIRAAFKAVMGGKQVAVLVPTTVLAQQHHQTFRERLSDYPVTVEMLSRFRSPKEQRAVLAGIGGGAVDIAIGTHRLISGDVRFKDLGLVVVDEEQRFGVRHKERFKELFQLVDVLTLSATPIPRTLYLSLMGARDLSLIETPPPNRIPVETMVCAYDERVIRDAVRRELARQGQVFFLHNRVRSIDRVAGRVRDLCPGARVEIGHGQMPEDDLERVMGRFVDGEIDVLVATTIIESGLDIPNANTIIIDRADRFGLADLYQLRGRVGRAQHKAYAYLLLPRDLMTVGAARKRVNAIKQYTALGAGFKIAMRDLEIRGAGNILGTAQSGHITAVGFDLYCQLLKQAISAHKGETVRPRLEVVLQLDFVVTREAALAGASGAPAAAPGPRAPAGIGPIPRVTAPPPAPAAAYLPAGFLPDAATRIKAYRDLAGVTGRDGLDRLERDWRDRFGPLPRPVENLLLLAAIKVVAAAQNVARVEVVDRKLMLTRRGDYLLIDGKFPRLTAGPDGDALLRETLALLRAL